MNEPLRKPVKAVALLKNLGARLSSDERAPYEKPEHDEGGFELADPTNPNLQALRTDENDAT